MTVVNTHVKTDFLMLKLPHFFIFFKYWLLADASISFHFLKKNSFSTLQCTYTYSSLNIYANNYYSFESWEGDH